MTIEERIGRTLNRLAVFERLLSLEGLEAAVHCGSVDKAALTAGLHELIIASYEDLEPIGHAPFAITNWEPDSDKQPEPDETGGARTAPPAAGS